MRTTASDDTVTTMTTAASTRTRRGFTVLEAALVVVIAVLVSSAAVAHFRGTSTLASDQTAQGSVDTAVAAALRLRMTNTTVTPANLASISGAVQYVDGTTVADVGNPPIVSVTATGWTVAAASKASDGSCWLSQASYDGPTGSPVRSYWLHEMTGPGDTFPCAGATATWAATNHPATAGNGDVWRTPRVLTVGP